MLPSSSPMRVYADLEEFIHAHRPHGELTWWTTPHTPRGYEVQVACPCGVVFERLDLLE